MKFRAGSEDGEERGAIPFYLEQSSGLRERNGNAGRPELHLVLHIICDVNFHFSHVLDEGSGEVSGSLPVLVRAAGSRVTGG